MMAISARDEGRASAAENAALATPPRARSAAWARVAGLALDLVYVCGFLLILPWILYLLVVRRRGVGSLRERFGLVPRLPPVAKRIWLHAVSVGELEAALPLVRALARRDPKIDIVISTTTRAANVLARRRCPERAVIYFPLDFSGAVRAVLKRLRPQALVLMELELWPNLLLAAGAARVPVLIANGRISERGAVRMRRWRLFLRPFLARIDRVLAQDETSNARFLALGVQPWRSAVLGNLKFDHPQIANGTEYRRAFEDSWGFAPASPRWIAGCTHRGEEEIALDVQARLRASIEGTSLILAPRHGERADEVVRLAASRGFRVAKYGARPPRETAPEVIVLDVTGELARLYAAADAAFVGGSLVRHGGHNLLEPVLAGVPVVHGPHMENFRAIARLLVEADGSREVRDPAQLAMCLESLLRGPGARAEIAERALALIEPHRGAAERGAAAILAALAVGND